MPSLRVLLRCLFILAFCLEGSLSLWASSAMAADYAHHVTATDQAQAVATGQDCEDDASRDDGNAGQHDCDCATGSGCMCACVFPAVAITHAVPFAAQHLLATQPVVPSRPSVALAAITPVFRPPIG